MELTQPTPVNDVKRARQRLSEGIAALPADVRRVYDMAVPQQRKFMEIAGALGISRQEVPELATKAVGLLRGHISDELLESVELKKVQQALCKKWQLSDEMIDRLFGDKR